MRYFKKQSAFSALVVLGAFVGQLQPTIAADLGAATPATPLPAHQGTWTLSVTPYSWLTFLRGEAGVRGRTTDIDADPIDVLERLDAVPYTAVGGSSIELYAYQSSAAAGDSFDIDGITLTAP